MSILLYIAVALLGLWWILKTRRRRVEKPVPGPRGWPLVGLGASLTEETLPERFAEFARQYGDIFQLKVFGSNLVVLNSAEYVRRAFNNDHYKQFMNDRSRTFYEDWILFGSQSIAFTERGFGSIHGDLSNGFTRAMHVYGEGRKDFEDRVKSELDVLVEKIELYNGEEFDIQALIKLSLTNVISILLGGPDLRNEEENVKMFWDFDRANDFLLNGRVDALMRACPWLRFLPTVYRDRYREIVAAKDAIAKKYFYDVKASHKPGVVRGLVDFLIDEQLQATEQGGDMLFTDERIVAMVLETIAAGVLPTMATTCSIILCLLNHPGYQTKIQKELDSVIGRDRRPTFADRQNCPLTEAVAMETQRYVTVLPFLLGHLCKPNIQFEGFDIEANSIIVPNAGFIHHDEKVWGDAWTFRPERWLDENGQLLPNDHPLRKSWLPFGTGRRQCISENFARSRVFLYVACLLQRWTLEAPPGRQVSCDPRKGHFLYAVTCRPKDVFCRAVNRE